MIRRLSLAVLALCAFPLVAAAQMGPPQDRYIVVLNEGLDLPENVAADVAIQTGGRVGYVYEHALRGFSITMPRAALAGVQRDPRVDYVEEDKPVTAFVDALPTGIERIFAGGNGNLRIDRNDGSGERVDADVAVLDTGIDWSHPDLNVVGGANCLSHTGGPPFSRSYVCEEDTDGSISDDGNSHGTHVAGMIGALDDGVNFDGIDVVGAAPGVRLWAVKVLDDNGSGSLGGIIAGIDWVAAKEGTENPIEVMNMSLGGSGQSDAVDAAIDSAVNEHGVVVVVSAGNSDLDAAGFTPANSPESFTVSAIADFDGAPNGDGSPTCRDDQDDTLADFSNWGPVVDITAPGVCILSSVPGGGYNDTYSGTSMSAPHVSGAAALLASAHSYATDRRGSDVDAIRNALVSNGNDGWLDDSGDGIQEPLLDVGNETVFNPVMVGDGGGDGGGDTNSAPTASFTYTCTDLTCDFDGTGSSDSDGSISSYDWNSEDDGIGTGETWSHQFASDGTYTVTLTVTDDGGATGSSSEDVSVSDSSGDDGGDSTTMHVHDLDGSSNKSGPTWTAIVSVLVHDGSAPGNGVTVTGDFSPVGGTGLSCGTDEGGWCHFESGNIGNNTKSVTFSVTSHPGGDHDSDGDSDGTTITVFR